MTATWTYLLADLISNKITAEVELTGVRLTKVLGASGTFSADLPLHKRFAFDPFVVSTPVKTAFYALRDGTPWWGGIVWTRRYNSESRSLNIAGADWWSYYDHRKILPVIVGDGSDTATLSTVYTGTEQNTIARNLLALAHSHTGGNIGVVASTANSGTSRDRSYFGYEMTDVGEALRQLSKVEGGPDMMFDVGIDSAGRPTRVMRLGTPWLGQVGAPHVFEYGANLTSYSWPSDGSRMSTRAWALGDGIEAGVRMAMAQDTSRYTDGWPLVETATSYSSVLEQSTLQGHANADLAVTSLPVVLPEIAVRTDVSPSIGDYAPGDDARVIIDDEFFVHGLDTRMRIVGVAVAPNDGVEQAALTMNPLLEDVA